MRIQKLHQVASTVAFFYSLADLQRQVDEKKLDLDIVGGSTMVLPTPKGNAMITIQVSDMTCGHCANAIARAVSGVDKDARVDILIPQKLVRVSSTASATELVGAIQEAGYTPREIPADPAPAATGRTSGGCCCGSRRTASVDSAQAASLARNSCCG